MKKLCLSLALAFGLSTGLWAELPSLPQGATSFGATIAGDYLYIYGGNTGKAHEFHKDCVKGDFFRLQMPDGEKWEQLPGGLGLLSCSLVAYDGTVIRIGGMNARNAKGEKNDLHSTDEVMKYDTKENKWVSLAPLPQPRSSHDSAVFGNTLYVGGGWQLKGHREGDWYNTVLTLDLKAPEKGWTEHKQPFERRAIATVAAGKRVWFIGGMNSDDEPSLQVDWFEPESGKWGKGPELPKGPMAGFGVAACAQNDRLYISPMSGKILTPNADETGWDEVAQMEHPRFFHRLLPLKDGRLIAVGGSSKTHQQQKMEIISTSAKAAPASEKAQEAAPSAALDDSKKKSAQR